MVNMTTHQISCVLCRSEHDVNPSYHLKTDELAFSSRPTSGDVACMKVAMISRIQSPQITVLSSDLMIGRIIRIHAKIHDPDGIDRAWWSIDGIMATTLCYHGAQEAEFATSLAGFSNGSVLSSAYHVHDNGTIIQGQPGQFNVALLQGNRYRIMIWANDTLGNPGYVEVWVIADFIPPAAAFNLSAITGKTGLTDLGRISLMRTSRM